MFKHHLKVVAKAFSMKNKWIWWVFWVVSLLALGATELVYLGGYLSGLAFDFFEVSYSGDINSERSFFISFFIISFVIGFIYFILILSKAFCVKPRLSWYVFFGFPFYFLMIVVFFFVVGSVTISNFFDDHAPNLLKGTFKCSLNLDDFYYKKSMKQLDSCSSNGFYVNGCSRFHDQVDHLLQCGDSYYLDCDVSSSSCCNGTSCYNCAYKMSKEDVQCVAKKLIKEFVPVLTSSATSLIWVTVFTFIFAGVLNILVARGVIYKNEREDLQP